MRATRAIRAAVAGFAVLAVAGTATAQTTPPAAPLEIGGFRLEGYGEAGVRFFPERPQDKENGKFEEYRDFNNGLFLQGPIWVLHARREVLGRVRRPAVGMQDQSST
jgi:hypothetical protein